MSPLPLALGVAAGGVTLLAATAVAPVPSRPVAVPAATRPLLDERRRAWVGPALAALGGAVLTPGLVPVVVAVTALRRRQRRLTAQRAEQAAVARDLPTVVDLLALCTSAGMALPLAHDHVAGRVGGAVGAALGQAAEAARAGRPRADALIAALSPLGPDASGLSRLLADHLRYGTPLAPGLARTSLELRLAQRRRAEESARRIPVRLLGPLVACVLPAFALLTVVPLLAASLRSLPL